MFEDRKAFFFDVDGTIASNEALVYEILSKVLDQVLVAAPPLTIIRPTYQEFCAVVGLPSGDMYDILLPGLDPALRKTITAEIRVQLEQALAAGRTVGIPGMPELIKLLAANGKQLFPASNGRSWYVKRVLGNLDLLQCFTEFVTIDMLSVRDKTELVAEIILRHQLEPSECVMIGDREGDITAGRSNGVGTVGCLFGNGSASELSRADIIVKDSKELADALL